MLPESSQHLKSCAQNKRNKQNFTEKTLPSSPKLSWVFQEFLSFYLQFPIECSLPWILVDHVIESPIIGLLESALMSFDIYNDAAQHALVILKQRFLYDEIEAEVTKCLIHILILLIQGNPFGHRHSIFLTSHMYMQSLYSAYSYALNSILNSIL